MLAAVTSSATGSLAIDVGVLRTATRALHHAFAPTFPAGAMLPIIPSDGGAAESGAAKLDLVDRREPPLSVLVISAARRSMELLPFGRPHEPHPALLGASRNTACGRRAADPRIHLLSLLRGLAQGWHLRLFDHADLEYGKLKLSSKCWRANLSGKTAAVILRFRATSGSVEPAKRLAGGWATSRFGGRLFSPANADYPNSLPCKLALVRRSGDVLRTKMAMRDQCHRDRLAFAKHSDHKRGVCPTHNPGLFAGCSLRSSAIPPWLSDLAIMAMAPKHVAPVALRV